MLAADLFEDRVRAGAAIAQIDRRAAAQIVVAVIDDVAGDALPERRDHSAAAVLGGDAGAADFHHATGQRVEHRPIEFAGRIETAGARCALAGEDAGAGDAAPRSEVRRVGKDCARTSRSQRSPYRYTRDT